jgi:polyisoprenoid-binding protein YceI
MTYTSLVRGTLAAMTCLLGAAAFAPSRAQQTLTLAPESKLWFDGKSTVRDWSCKAPVMTATLTLAEAATAAVLAGDEPQATTLFSVPTMKLDCSNGTMNNHMRKAIAAEKFGEISFALKSYEAVAEAGAATKGTLRGDLTIKGVAKEVVLPVEFVAAGDGLRVKGTYALKMTDWGVEPPKLMMGTMKVREMVTVSFDLLLQQ